jgi:hypothetical protein
MMWGFAGLQSHGVGAIESFSVEVLEVLEVLVNNESVVTLVELLLLRPVYAAELTETRWEVADSNAPHDATLTLLTVEFNETLEGRT